jgi:hypothetical protein
MPATGYFVGVRTVPLPLSVYAAVEQPPFSQQSQVTLSRGS